MSDRQDGNGANGSAAPTSIAGYIGAMTDQLARLAKASGFECLGYILDVARLEADAISKRPDEPGR